MCYLISAYLRVSQICYFSLKSFLYFFLEDWFANKNLLSLFIWECLYFSFIYEMFTPSMYALLYTVASCFSEVLHLSSFFFSLCSSDCIISIDLFRFTNYFSCQFQHNADLSLVHFKISVIVFLHSKISIWFFLNNLYFLIGILYVIKDCHHASI